MAARWEDDDDWVGTPPEGRHTRAQSKPDFWRTQNAILPGIGFTILIVIVIVLLLVV